MVVLKERETGILLPNNQRQHRTSHAPKDVLPLRICAIYSAPCQPLQGSPRTACDRHFRYRRVFQLLP